MNIKEINTALLSWLKKWVITEQPKDRDFRRGEWEAYDLIKSRIKQNSKTDKINIDDKIEEIIETILEHCDCEHDYEPSTSSYPGHSDVSYSLECGADGKVYAAIKEILEKEEI